MWCLGEQSAQAKCPNTGKGEPRTAKHVTAGKTISKQEGPKPWSGVQKVIAIPRRVQRRTWWLYVEYLRSLFELQFFYQLCVTDFVKII